MTDFDRFWQAYPRKRGKGQAQRTWAKLKPSKELVEKILIAIDKQKKAGMIKSNDPYTKHPSTWLNAGCWEDEIEGEVLKARQRAESERRMAEWQYQSYKKNHSAWLMDASEDEIRNHPFKSANFIRLIKELRPEILKWQSVKRL